MSAESVSAATPVETTLALPALHTATLDAMQVEQLLTDIETCTENLDILPKYAARGAVPDAASVTLVRARELLATRAVRGLQLRYHYDGADWWDTVMVVGDQFRVVRIRHDFSGASNTIARGAELP